MSTTHTYHEHALLERVASGDTDSFAILFNSYYRLLVSFINRFTESVPVAEDITQDVFLKIWLTRETLGSVNNFRAYLLTAAKNQTMNALKKNAREKSGSAGLDLTEDNGDDINELFGLIDEAIEQLPPQRKKVYILARHQRLSYEEIGSRLGLSSKTVKKHMQLAIASITNYLKGKVDARLLLSLIIFLKKF